MKIRSVDLSIYLADKTDIGINIDGEQTAEAAIKILSAFTESVASDVDQVSADALAAMRATLTGKKATP